MKTFLRIIALLLLISLILIQHKAPTASEAWQTKVDEWVLAYAEGEQTEFIVFLNQQTDLSRARELKTKTKKGAYVFYKLTKTARNTQRPLLETLDEMGNEYRPYWIANMVWVRGDTADIQSIAKRPDVAHIYANAEVQLDLPDFSPGEDEADTTANAPSTFEWNISLVGAPQVWAAGFSGQGVVVAGQDTGYEWEHPALINQYRGWDGLTADHNYNWHDAIHSGNNIICPPDSPAPCDDHNHGTHTMGTMIGDDGGSNQIGMAPGARWIGCRNMDRTNGTPITYSECYQFFLAPTDLNNENPDPNKAPDVINNSWRCPASEGCTDPNILLTVVNNVRAAGILTAHSAGNAGSACGTVTEPAAIYDASFTVGATDNSDVIASFSSRGPVTVDGSNRPKPDISAPGVNIYSSVRNGMYAGGLAWSGTSMAAPHVAGLVALLISSNPELAGQVDEIEQLVEQNAVPLTTTQNCGSTPGMAIPNNTYGWGRIDAFRTVFSMTNFLPVILSPASP